MAKADNIVWHPSKLTATDRAKALGQRGATLWLTGLSGSGKSSIAVALEQRLVERGHFAYRLDGDNLRFGLCRDLGFSPADRRENIRRVGEVARLFADAGAIAISSFISPYLAERAAAKALHVDAGLPFFEVFVDAPLEECERRDPKGLYAKARRGEISGMTGIDDPYEAPVAPALVLRTAETSLSEAVDACMALLRREGVLLR